MYHSVTSRKNEVEQVVFIVWLLPSIFVVYLFDERIIVVSSIRSLLFWILQIDAFVEPINNNARVFERRQLILGMAITGSNVDSTTDDDNPNQPLEKVLGQKIRRIDQIDVDIGFQFLSVIFSHIGQMHAAIKQFIQDQILHKLVWFDEEAKQFMINSTMS